MELKKTWILFLVSTLFFLLLINPVDAIWLNDTGSFIYPAENETASSSISYNYPWEAGTLQINFSYIRFKGIEGFGTRLKWWEITFSTSSTGGALAPVGGAPSTDAAYNCYYYQDGNTTLEWVKADVSYKVNYAVGTWKLTFTFKDFSPGYGSLTGNVDFALAGAAAEHNRCRYVNSNLAYDGNPFRTNPALWDGVYNSMIFLGYHPDTCAGGWGLNSCAAQNNAQPVSVAWGEYFQNDYQYNISSDDLDMSSVNITKIIDGTAYSSIVQINDSSNIMILNETSYNSVNVSLYAPSQCFKLQVDPFSEAAPTLSEYVGWGYECWVAEGLPTSDPSYDVDECMYIEATKQSFWSTEAASFYYTCSHTYQWGAILGNVFCEYEIRSYETDDIIRACYNHCPYQLPYTNCVCDCCPPGVGDWYADRCTATDIFYLDYALPVGHWKIVLQRHGDMVPMYEYASHDFYIISDEFSIEWTDNTYHQNDVMQVNFYAPAPGSVIIYDPDENEVYNNTSVSGSGNYYFTSNNTSTLGIWIAEICNLATSECEYDYTELYTEIPSNTINIVENEYYVGDLMFISYNVVGIGKMLKLDDVNNRSIVSWTINGRGIINYTIPSDLTEPLQYGLWTARLTSLDREIEYDNDTTTVYSATAEDLYVAPDMATAFTEGFTAMGFRSSESKIFLSFIICSLVGIGLAFYTHPIAGFAGFVFGVYMFWLLGMLPMVIPVSISIILMLAFGVWLSTMLLGKVGKGGGEE